MNFDKKRVLRFYGWSEKPTIEECAGKAYKDLARTMLYNMPNQDDKNASDDYEKAKENYKIKICELINGRITDLLNGDLTDFDGWHKATCNSIVNESKKDKIIKVFYYGQAQKWLNMTFKNMFIIDVFLEEDIKNSLYKIEKDLHIPIDNIMLDIAKNDFELSSCKKSWSRWDFEEYDKFQSKLLEVVKQKVQDITPIEWEFERWLKERDKKSKKSEEHIANGISI